MNKSTQPDILTTLKFCLLVIDKELEESRGDIVLFRENKAHQYNLQKLLQFVESEEKVMSSEISRESYLRCIKAFGRKFTEQLFKDTKVVDHFVPPVNAEKLFADIKAKGSASRTKVIQQQPAGFFNEESAKGFQDVLFSRKGANGYHEGTWPKIATTFSELRQAKVQGELSMQFSELCNNILSSSEYDAETKAKKMASLAAEYADLVKGEK